MLGTTGQVLTQQTQQLSRLGSLDTDIKRDPRDAGTWLGRAEALGELGSHAEALVAYQRALNINPMLPMAQRGKAPALREAGQMAEALEAIDKATASGNVRTRSTSRRS